MMSGSRLLERHGIAMSMFIENAPLRESDLWVKLEAALDVVASHRSIWLARMRASNNSIHVRRIPGLRAQLREGRFTILDPYLLANFLPSQIAASIIHEACHALLRSRRCSGHMSRAREERICRRAELRFGRALARADVAGAELVIDRAATALSMSDDGVAPEVDPAELRTIGIVTRISELRVPKWYKRVLARRYRVLDTPQGRTAFGA